MHMADGAWHELFKKKKKKKKGTGTYEGLIVTIT
jgi:hypothetical protein